MFTGIIEKLGQVTSLKKENDNLHISIKSDFTSALKVDQSVAHNGVCLTVIALSEDIYTVTAIKETLDKTNLNALSVGTIVNLERAMKLGDRLDGHIVQGHVDQIGKCVDKYEENGSWVFTFSYDAGLGNLTIEKGSITINGISLTVVNSKATTFSVAIIPYTYEHTNLSDVVVGDHVNLEFDVIGKYVAKLHSV
jgi:riboflavin synthase